MRAMREQADRHEVMVRCAVCEQRRPGYGTALLRMVPAAQGWQVYRVERVAAQREPFTIGVSALGDPRWGLADEDGTLRAPWVLPTFVQDPPRQLRVECRGCDRKPFLVRHAAVAHRAEARGDRDAYV